jgi:hypothetical protein
MLARIARRDPRCLRRTTKSDRVAAALVYLAGRASGEFGGRGSRTEYSLWRWWGISSCADRARTMRDAAGLGPARGRWSDITRDDLPLGDTTLLHSSYREQLRRERDYLKEYATRMVVVLGLGDTNETRELARRVYNALDASGSRGDS